MRVDRFWKIIETDFPVRGLGAVIGSTVDFLPYVSLYLLERSRSPRNSSLLQWRLCENDKLAP